MAGSRCCGFFLGRHRLAAPDGQRYHHFTGTPIPEEGGAGIALVARLAGSVTGAF